jgi:chromosome segregation ATPase
MNETFLIIVFVLVVVLSGLGALSFVAQFRRDTNGGFAELDKLRDRVAQLEDALKNEKQKNLENLGLLAQEREALINVIAEVSRDLALVRRKLEDTINDNRDLTDRLAQREAEIQNLEKLLRAGNA